MIVAISGVPGSGKSTVAKLIAKKLKLKHYSTGDFMREIAKKRNISLMELSKIAEHDGTIDYELDERQIKLGKEEDNFVIDARLAFHFIPNSIKIFLDADIKESAKRVFKDKRKIEQYKNLDEAIKEIKKRKQSETQRYKKYYRLNCYDRNNYDFVLDTTNLTIEQAVNEVVKFIEKKCRKK